MPKIKAIITDLDRTLLRTDKSLSSYTVSVLKKCKEQGIKIIAATARPERSIVEYDAMVGFDVKVVMNGAKIIKDEEVFLYGIFLRDACDILDKLNKRKDFLISVETGEVLYARDPIPEFEYTLYEEFPFYPADEIAYKILVSGDGAEEFVRENLPESLRCTLANGHLVQIMPKDTSKKNSIKAVLDAYCITPGEAVYFGDDYDDMESLQLCGYGIAVDNAIPEVKAVADEITGNNDEDGVAQWLEKRVLNGCWTVH